MIKHQYPTQREANRLSAMSLSDLEYEYKSGNVAAAVILGKKTSLMRDFLEGQAILRNQTLAGNMYAYYAISESHFEKSPPNLVDSIAYLRVAYLLGDYKAAREIANMGLSSAEIAAGDARALQLISGFSGNQEPDPRPQE